MCLATETYMKKKARRKVETLYRLHSLTLVKPTAAPRAAPGADSTLWSFFLSVGCQNLAAAILVGNGGWNLAEQKRWFLLLANKDLEE